jgi:hypothetical protein
VWFLAALAWIGLVVGVVAVVWPTRPPTVLMWEAPDMVYNVGHIWSESVIRRQRLQAVAVGVACAVLPPLGIYAVGIGIARVRRRFGTGQSPGPCDTDPV